MCCSYESIVETDFEEGKKSLFILYHFCSQGNRVYFCVGTTECVGTIEYICVGTTEYICIEVLGLHL